MISFLLHSYSDKVIEMENKLRIGVGGIYKGNVRQPCGDGTVLYLSCIGDYMKLNMG